MTDTDKPVLSDPPADLAARIREAISALMPLPPEWRDRALRALAELLESPPPPKPDPYDKWLPVLAQIVSDLAQITTPPIVEQPAPPVPPSPWVNNPDDGYVSNPDGGYANTTGLLNLVSTLKPEQRAAVLTAVEEPHRSALSALFDALPFVG